jgi:hypothetical protein
MALPKITLLPIQSQYPDHVMSGQKILGDLNYTSPSFRAFETASV